MAAVGSHATYQGGPDEAGSPPLLTRDRPQQYIDVPAAARRSTRFQGISRCPGRPDARIFGKRSGSLLRVPTSVAKSIVASLNRSSPLSTPTARSRSNSPGPGPHQQGGDGGAARQRRRRRRPRTPEFSAARPARPGRLPGAAGGREQRRRARRDVRAGPGCGAHRGVPRCDPLPAQAVHVRRVPRQAGAVRRLPRAGARRPTAPGEQRQTGRVRRSGGGRRRSRR